MLDHVSVPYCPCCAGLEDHERDCPLRSPGATTWGWTALHLAGEPPPRAMASPPETFTYARQSAEDAPGGPFGAGCAQETWGDPDASPWLLEPGANVYA